MKNYVFYLMMASVLFLTLSCKKSKEDVPINGITLSQNAAVLAIGGELTLTAVFTPDNATDQNLFWESDNPDVATVANGVVTAKTKEGTAEITVTSKNGTATATCNVTVTSRQMTLTRTTSGTVTIELVGSGYASVDWGDGSDLETKTLSSSTTEFKRTASGTIKISGANITEFFCANNQLTGLDVSKNTELIVLWCNRNLLTTLNIIGCTKLRELYCNANQLSSFNANGCAALNQLNCVENELTSLSLNGCVALASMNCGWNQLSGLDVSECVGLLTLHCNNNELMSLDVSTNTKLRNISCKINDLSITELNNLFGTLHSIDLGVDKIIYIYDNPGTGSFTHDTVLGNGWKIDTAE